MAGKLNEIALRLKALFRRRRMSREMAEELEFHHEMLRTKLERQGMTTVEADIAARRRFGNAGRWGERLHELWQFRGFENLQRDVIFSIRLLRKSPGFTAVALLTLVLGVGANTTVFSMIDGMLLRPLDVPESGRLAVIAIDMGQPRLRYSFPEPMFRGLESRHQVLSEVFAFNDADLQVRNGSTNENVYGQFVSGDFFTAMRTAPLLGRTLGEADDRPGGNPEGFGAVISESFWQTWFNRAPDIVGRRIQVDNVAFTVVGVMPKRFIGADPMQRPQLFVPLSTELVLNGDRSLTAAGNHGWWLTVMGRLQPGVSIEQARSQLAAATGSVLRERAADADSVQSFQKRKFEFTAEPGSAGFTYLRMNFRKPLVAVFAMCGGILLLACLNLASLLMARGAARQRELATRLAMGGTRRRLIQQLMVESFLLGVIGTALGLAIAPFVSRFLAAVLLSGNRDAYLDTSLDARMFAFAAIAAIAITLLSGLVPAFQATSRNLADRIKDGQHATQTQERRRILPRVLLSIEVGLALMLVMGAGLLATSLTRLYRSGEGFDPQGVENIEFSLDKLGLKGDAVARFYQEMGENLSRQAGVKNVSFALIVPLDGRQWDMAFKSTEGADKDIYLNSVAPGYFAAMRIPTYAGRDFTWNDTKASGRKIVLNESAVKALFPDGNVLGRLVKMSDEKEPTAYEVIGVVGDAKYEDMQSMPPPTAYLPITQRGDHGPPSYTAIARIDGPATPLAGAVRAISARMAPAMPAPTMTSMSSVLDDSLSAERLMAMLSVFFGLCAMIVTAIGLYGTLAYATARRTTEIGIRMALGARRAQVVGLVFGQNLAVMLAGTVTGLVAALLAARALASFLYGTSTHDPWVMAGSILTLGAIASAASLLPALRASRIEPMAAIRCE